VVVVPAPVVVAVVGDCVVVVSVEDEEPLLFVVDEIPGQAVAAALTQETFAADDSAAVAWLCLATGNVATASCGGIERSRDSRHER